MEPYTQSKAVCALHVLCFLDAWESRDSEGVLGEELALRQWRGGRTLGVLPATVNTTETDTSSLLVYIRATQQGFPRTACLLHRGITQMTQPTQPHFPNRVYLEMLWSFGGKLMKGKLEATAHNVASQVGRGRGSLCKSCVWTQPRSMYVCKCIGRNFSIIPIFVLLLEVGSSRNRLTRCPDGFCVKRQKACHLFPTFVRVLALRWMCVVRDGALALCPWTLLPSQEYTLYCYLYDTDPLDT